MHICNFYWNAFFIILWNLLQLRIDKTRINGHLWRLIRSPFGYGEEQGLVCDCYESICVKIDIMFRRTHSFMIRTTVFENSVRKDTLQYVWKNNFHNMIEKKSCQPQLMLVMNIIVFIYVYFTVQFRGW